MSPVASARASLVVSLMFACNERPVDPKPTPTAAPAEVAEGADEVKFGEPPVRTGDASGPRPRVAPRELPASLAEPPPPERPPPPGTPTAEGRVDTLLALDGERAVVRFFVPGRDHGKLWWIALLRRDGSVEWVQPLSGDVARGEGSSGLVRAGDSVSIATSELAGDDPRVTLRGFALADGAPRFTAALGPGFVTNTIADGELRVDTRVRYLFVAGGGVEAELTATSPQGVVWRAVIGAPIPVGHDPTVVGDAIAVRTEERRSSETRWLVFARSSGQKRGELLAAPQSCSDGRRWFVLGANGLLEVDATAVTTRPVMAPPTLPGAAGTWVLEDCTIAGGAPVVLVARGHRKALVALDPTTLAIAGHVELGAASIGTDGFDPLPARTHRALVVRTLVGEADELLVADPVAGRVIGRWRSRAEFGGFSGVVHWTGGVALGTANTVSIVAADGALEGRAVVPEVSLDEGQIVGDTLWLPPVEPLRLGRRAPRVLSLAAPATDAVRDAVLVDLQSAEDAARTEKRPPCPDPRSVVHGDGVAIDPKLAPVTPGRLPAWDLEILRETARMLACAPASAPVRLMAWYVMEDDRPLRNDNALLLVEDGSAAPPRFSLVQVYRHATNHAWNTAGSFHDPREPLRTFDHRPTRAEVDAFLEQSGWTFADGWGRVIAGNVVDDEWRAATMEAPWRSFARDIERPD